MNYRATANRISAMLRREGLYTKIWDPEKAHPGLGKVVAYLWVQVGVYSDAKLIHPVGSVEVYDNGSIKCEGDPALCELVKAVPTK